MAGDHDFEVTPLKISTITATGGVGSAICMDAFFQHVALVVPERDADSDGIVYVEYGSCKTEKLVRGERPTRGRRLKRFDNQSTVILRMRAAPPAEWYHINLKLFRNGSVQMTGVKRIDDGQRALDILVAALQAMPHGVVAEPDRLSARHYSVCMINSDCHVNFDVRREALHYLMMEAFPGVHCNFEPCIYPGVRIKFFHNDQHPHHPCCLDCADPKDCACRKITVAVFRSGCVIITGAQSMAQLEDAREFIISFLREHQATIQQPVHILPDPKQVPSAKQPTVKAARPAAKPQLLSAKTVDKKPPKPAPKALAAPKDSVTRLDQYFRITTSACA